MNLEGIHHITAVTGNAWSVTVTPEQATALADGSYTVQADVSDLAGNPAVPASQAFAVDATAPTVAIAPIATDNLVNLAEATAGFAIAGTTAGIDDGQSATVTIRDGANTVVDSYTAAVAGNAWSVTVTCAPE